MKKLFATALCALAIVSCSQRNGTIGSAGNIQLDSIVIDTAYHIAASSDSSCCQLRLSMIYFKGQHAHRMNAALLNSELFQPTYNVGKPTFPSIRKALEALVSYRFSEYKNEYALFHDGDTRSDSPYSRTFHLSTEVRTTHDGHLTYMFRKTWKEPFTPAYHELTTLNFNLMTGLEMHLPDLFLPEATPGIIDLIVKQLAHDNHVADLTALKNRNFFRHTQLYIPSNFILGDDAITFIYNAGEIASNETGIIMVEIDRDKLQKYLK